MDSSRNTKRRRVSAYDDDPVVAGDTRLRDQVFLLKLPSRQPIKVSCSIDDDPLNVATRIVRENRLSPIDDYLHPIVEWFSDQVRAIANPRADRMRADVKLFAGVAASAFFRSIPPELSVTMCAYLSAVDLFHLELVSTRFAVLAQIAWKSPRFTSFEVSDLFARRFGGNANIDDYFRRFKCLLDRIGKNVQELSFTGPADGNAEDSKAVHFVSSAAILAIAKHAPNLKRLHFNRAILAPDQLCLIGRLTTLESLSLIEIESYESVPSTHPCDDDEVAVRDADEKVAALCRSYDASLSAAVRPLTRLRELRIRLWTADYWLYYLYPSHGCSLSLLDSVSSSLRVLEMKLAGGNLALLRDFIRSHGELLEFSASGAGEFSRVVELTDGPSIIRSLVDCCPKLKRLSLSYLGEHAFDDVRLLHGLESLELCATKGRGLHDGDVIEICERNLALKKLDIEPKDFTMSAVVPFTKRAFTDGYSRLHRLQSLFVEEIDLDDAAFEAVIRANSASLRKVEIRSPRHLSVGALRLLGFLCSSLEELRFQGWCRYNNYRSAWYSPAAMHEFAKAVAASNDTAASTGTPKERRVKVIVEGRSGHGDLRPLGHMSITRLVTVTEEVFCVSRTTFQY